MVYVEDTKWIQLSLDRVQCWTFVNAVIDLWTPKETEYPVTS
jgi:hypothetical protein